MVLAHTGGEDEFPGSTMFGYGESVKAGVDMLDLNVMLTGDGVLVIQHDDSVDRLTNSTGKVADMTYAELSALDNAYWFTADGVQRDQRVHQLEHQAAQRVRPKDLDVGAVAVGRSRAELHQIERRPDHLCVVAEQFGTRNRDVGRTQRRDHPVLPAHVMRRCLHMGKRRPAQHEFGAAVAHRVRQIRPAAREQPRRQRAGE